MIRRLNALINLGVAQNDSYFIRQLKRVINIMTYNAAISIVIAFSISLGKEQLASALPLLSGLLFYGIVLYYNYLGRCFTAVSILFTFSAILLGTYSIKSGEDSYTHVHFILNFIGLALLYQKETPRVYFYFNLLITIVIFTFVMVSFNNHWFDGYIEDRFVPADMRRTNLFFLLASSIIFAFLVIYFNNRQQKAMAQALEDQKILLAEVNHRVKNNLSIIIGLLNLKKELVQEAESVQSLKDIRDRIMSMALVHKMMYENDNRNEIQIETYIQQLTNEIKNSFNHHTKDVLIHTQLEKANINLSCAIPLGLILNELITNSFKHAFSSTSQPQISIQMSRKDNKMHLDYSDNGMGIIEFTQNDDSLGMSLIRGLSEQLDANYNFYNRNGLHFELSFSAVLQ